MIFESWQEYEDIMSLFYEFGDGMSFEEWTGESHEEGRMTVLRECETELDESPISAPVDEFLDVGEGNMQDNATRTRKVPPK